MTLSVDHKIIDGATAAVFLSELKTLLEDPKAGGL
jgi:pyruvate/2-oxoglutarate dehydrogenase complex dihydrolipoamide acyltransferase (E2) component